MSLAPLVLLPSGEHIDPADVSRLVPLPRLRQVLIVMRAGADAIVELAPDASAQAVVDRIAAEVNAARSKASSVPVVSPGPYPGGLLNGPSQEV